MESGEKQHSVYEAWQQGIGQYLELYGKGLKKQANRQLSGFISQWEHSVPEEDLGKTLRKFCREICDEGKYPQLLNRGNGSLPYALGRLVWNYLKKQCEAEAMPEMRWAFQLFGKYYNPFDPQLRLNLFQVLEKAYKHSGCDSKTVELYFNAILEQLSWGSHHFPHGCIVKKEVYKEAVKAAELVLAEKQVPLKLAEAYAYYCKLYQCFYEYEESGREKDFDELCAQAGISYKRLPAY